MAREGLNERWAAGYDMVDVVLAAMLLWLLHMSQSATSLTCATAAVAMFLAAGATSQHPRRIMTLTAVASLCYFVLEATTGVKGYILHILGRRPDLTDRTLIWAATSKIAGNPWVGVGYQSFWLGDRLTEVWKTTGAHLIQAHNGYLEQYLNLGVIGVALVVAMMALGFYRVRNLLARDYGTGVLMFSFIIVVALYNYTEASFYAVNNLWLLFVIAVVQVPKRDLSWMETMTVYAFPTAGAAGSGRPGSTGGGIYRSKR
jgi:O-antigen ligase